MKIQSNQRTQKEKNKRETYKSKPRQLDEAASRSALSRGATVSARLIPGHTEIEMIFECFGLICGLADVSFAFFFPSRVGPRLGSASSTLWRCLAKTAVRRAL